MLQKKEECLLVVKSSDRKQTEFVMELNFDKNYFSHLESISNNPEEFGPLFGCGLQHPEPWEKPKHLDHWKNLYIYTYFLFFWHLCVCVWLMIKGAATLQAMIFNFASDEKWFNDNHLFCQQIDKDKESHSNKKDGWMDRNSIFYSSVQTTN